MKKNLKYYLVIWAVLVAIFNVVVFVARPLNPGYTIVYDARFWVSWGFIIAAFAGQLICSMIALRSDEKKLFLRLPLITVSYSGLFVSMVAGIICMLISDFPSWITIISCVLILSFYIIAALKASAAADIVGDKENKVKSKTFFIKCLTVDMDSLVAQAKSDEVKTEIKRLYDTVKYSDPMSSDALSGVESQITIQVSSLIEAVAADDCELVKSIVNEALILLNDRNKKCILLK